jgi:hypothetical protein
LVAPELLAEVEYRTGAAEGKGLVDDGLKGAY